jgi:hypothetical protein
MNKNALIEAINKINIKMNSVSVHLDNTVGLVKTKYKRVNIPVIPILKIKIFHLLPGLELMESLFSGIGSLSIELIILGIHSAKYKAKTHPIHINQLYVDKSIELPKVLSEIDSNTARVNPIPSLIPFFWKLPFTLFWRYTGKKIMKHPNPIPVTIILRFTKRKGCKILHIIIISPIIMNPILGKPLLKKRSVIGVKRNNNAKIFSFSSTSIRFNA